MNNPSNQDTITREVRLFKTEPHSCSYIDHDQAVTLFIDPQYDVDTLMYDFTARQGYRRSGNFFYKPQCINCNRCISARVPVGLFQPNKSQRRCLKRNRDIRLNVVRHIAIDTHYPLFERYINARHIDGDMYPASLSQFTDFIATPRSETLYIELLLENQLIGCALTDKLPTGLSAIYTYFDPDLPSRSLGRFAILSQIQLCQQLHKPYFYLGYRVDESTKMAYKVEYQPQQLFIDGHWRQENRR